MIDPSVDRALGALDGRVSALERWTAGLDDKLAEASDSSHELATQVALMRQSMDRFNESAQSIKEVRDDMAQMKGAGRIALGVMFAVGGLGGSIAGSVGAAWVRRVFGWE